MATLDVEVKLDKGATSPFVAIDQLIVPIDGRGKGTIVVVGTDGDKSVHQLLMSWHGAAGATMQVEVKSGARSLVKTGILAIPAASEPYGGNRRSFKL